MEMEKTVFDSTVLWRIAQQDAGLLGSEVCPFGDDYHPKSKGAASCLDCKLESRHTSMLRGSIEELEAAYELARGGLNPSNPNPATTVWAVVCRSTVPRKAMPFKGVKDDRLWVKGLPGHGGEQGHWLHVTYKGVTRRDRGKAFNFLAVLRERGGKNHLAMIKLERSDCDVELVIGRAESYFLRGELPVTQVKLGEGNRPNLWVGFAPAM